MEISTVLWTVFRKQTDYSAKLCADCENLIINKIVAFRRPPSKCKTRKQIDNYWTGLHKPTCVIAASSLLCCYRVNQFSQKSIPPVEVWQLVFVFLCNCSYRGDFRWKFKVKGLKGAKGYWVQVVGRMLHTFVPFRQHEHLIFCNLNNPFWKWHAYLNCLSRYTLKS